MTHFDPEGEFTETKWEAILNDQGRAFRAKLDSLHEALREANNVD